MKKVYNVPDVIVLRLTASDKVLATEDTWSGIGLETGLQVGDWED